MLLERMMELSSEEINQIRNAKYLLENTSLAAKIAGALGTPIEKGFELLPTGWKEHVRKSTSNALMSALKVALATMNKQPGAKSSPRFHKLLGALSGAAGGAFGLPAMIIELPVSTTIMLRSIADIAQSYGEDVSDIPARFACLEVFALGGRSSRDDASELGYYAVRSTLAKSLAEAAQYVAEKGLVEEGAPAVVRFISQIAARFSVPVSEKTAAQAVPVLGAVGGALVNTLFIDHFQDVSQGHFALRKLERRHGIEMVQQAYDSLAEDGPPG